MDFKSRLKDAMEYAGIRHKELSERAGVTQRALLTYVSATPSMPPADVAVRIAKVLGVTVEYLVCGENPASPPEDLRRRIKRQVAAVIDDIFDEEKRVVSG